MMGFCVYLPYRPISIGRNDVSIWKENGVYQTGTLHLGHSQ